MTFNELVCKIKSEFPCIKTEQYFAHMWTYRDMYQDVILNGGIISDNIWLEFYHSHISYPVYSRWVFNIDENKVDVETSDDELTFTLDDDIKYIVMPPLEQPTSLIYGTIPPNYEEYFDKLFKFIKNKVVEDETLYEVE